MAADPEADQNAHKDISSRDVYNINFRKFSWKQRAMSPNAEYIPEHLTSNNTQVTDLKLDS